VTSTRKADPFLESVAILLAHRAFIEDSCPCSFFTLQVLWKTQVGHISKVKFFVRMRSICIWYFIVIGVKNIDGCCSFCICQKSEGDTLPLVVNIPFMDIITFIANSTLT